MAIEGQVGKRPARAESLSEAVERARGLAPNVAAAAGEIERSQRLPRDLTRALVEAGMFRLLVPRSLGGLELSLAEFSLVLEEIGKADASTAWCISQNAGVAVLSAHLPPEGAREIFQPHTVLAGGHGPARAVKVEGGYTLTGRWNFGSGMHQATWLRATCDLVDEAGRPLRERRARGSLILFVPAEQVAVIDAWQVSGLRGTGSDSYAVTDLFVPEEHAVQERCFEEGTLYVFGTNAVFSTGFASVALGVARASMDAFLELAVGKTARGMAGPLREQAAVQLQVARSEAALRSARALLHEAVEEAWQAAETRRRLELEQRALLRLATTFAIERAAEVVDSAYHAAGATAIFASNAFERRFRDMHAITQQMQARQDHYETVGKYFLGLEPQSEWF